MCGCTLAILSREPAQALVSTHSSRRGNSTASVSQRRTPRRLPLSPSSRQRAGEEGRLSGCFCRNRASHKPLGSGIRHCWHSSGCERNPQHPNCPLRRPWDLPPSPSHRCAAQAWVMWAERLPECRGSVRGPGAIRGSALWPALCSHDALLAP